MSPPPWKLTTNLTERTTWLLEASAGTGKTYQIAALFTRMVAEYGIPVESILTITFTTAATAELGERIRARLRDTLLAVETGPADASDELVCYLRANVNRETLLLRLRVALLDFDLAPISTIHGFAQRTLSEFAFDSGQDAGLTLLEDVSDLVGQQVDDALASLYAAASVDLITLFEDFAFTRANLIYVTKTMTAPTAPVVHPNLPTQGSQQLALGRQWLETVAAMRVVFAAEQARATAGLLEDHAAKRFSKEQDRWLLSAMNKLGAWLDHNAPPLTDDYALLQRLTSAGRTKVWRGAPESLPARPYWTLALALDRLLEAQADFAQRFAPLATFALGVRARYEDELTRRRALTFDAMLSRLAERMRADGGDRSVLASRLRDRYPVVFVDEFQDTDECQWQVIRDAFHGHCRLLLIGDPKQAIYRFRGADVQVYLGAKATVAASNQYTMTSNFRSDPSAVQAMNTLFRGGSHAFDEDGIDYVAVTAEKPARLEPQQPGMVVRWVDARTRGGAEGAPIDQMPRGLLAKLAAREVLGWLDGTTKIRQKSGGTAAVVASDLAVLVGTHFEGQAIRKALSRVGVPAVGGTRSSVFASPVATWMAAWLDGVGAAGRDLEARAAAVTPLVGWSARELAWSLKLESMGDEAGYDALRDQVQLSETRHWGDWTARLHDASELWERSGFFATFDRESSELGILPRLLRWPGGERHATDLRHLVELLHIEERTHRSGASELAAWLRAQSDVDSEAFAQRLESDERAVRIETVHASKGLQYPIVLLPFASAWRKPPTGNRPTVVRPGKQAPPELHLHARGTPHAAEAIERAHQEERREDLRKAYVALTRGEHQTVVTVGPLGQKGGGTLARSAYTRLIMRESDRAGFDDDTLPDFSTKLAPAGWTLARQRLDDLQTASGGTLSWFAEPPLGDELARLPQGPTASGDVHSVPWRCGRRSLMESWKVTSYTGLSGSHDREEKIFDEPPKWGDDGDERSGRPRDVRIAPPIPPYTERKSAPQLTRGAGKHYGTWIHKIFEQIDFATGVPPGAPDADWLENSARESGFSPSVEIVHDVAEHLQGVLRTPLGSAATAPDPLGLPADFCLASIDRKDRLDELAFDLSLGGGTAWRRGPYPAGGDAFATRPGCVDPAAVHRALALADDGSLPGVSAWVAQFSATGGRSTPIIGSMSGILTGAIDLVFRSMSGSQDRYFVVDYKTNKIGASLPGHFTRAFMDSKMADMNYYLQSLLYTVALHRFLGGRMSGYTYASHMGGFMYLFVRGMSGPDTEVDEGRRLGVFAHRWPEGAVAALDRALGGVT